MMKLLIIYRSPLLLLSSNFLRIRINFLRHFDPFDPLKHSALVIILLILITFSVDVGHSWEKRRGDEIEVG